MLYTTLTLTVFTLIYITIIIVGRFNIAFGQSRLKTAVTVKKVNGGNFIVNELIDRSPIRTQP